MNKPLKISFILFALLCSSLMVFAKRMAPKPVKQVLHKGIRYSAPHELMGCIVADKGSGRFWWKQIYVVRYDTSLETDVQDVFITSLSIKDDKLIIENEKGFTYSLDPNSLDIKVLKGTAIVETHW